MLQPHVSVSQVLFIADIFVRARMSFDVAGVAVSDPKLIWRAYRRSWLPVDVIAAVPWWLSGVRELKLLQVCTPPAPLHPLHPHPPCTCAPPHLHGPPHPQLHISTSTSAPPNHRTTAPPRHTALDRIPTPRLGAFRSCSASPSS